MYTALIVAAGSGTRTRLPFNKVFYEIKGKPLVLYSVEKFLADSDCEEVIVVHSAGDAPKMIAITKNYPLVKLVTGGETRQQSVFAGLKVAKGKSVFIHDAARPNWKRAQLEALKKGLAEKGAATLGIPVRDTVVDVIEGCIGEHLNREKTYAIQTPQAFRTEEILKAHVLASHTDTVHTDDTSVYLATFNNKDVKIVLGDEDNVKVTTKADLLLMEGLL